MIDLQFSSSRKRLLGLSLISIADIVLLLLIFFLLTSSFVLESGIRVKLPTSSQAIKEPVQRHIITITRAGKIYINDRLVLLSNLEQSLLKLQQNSPRELLVIQADSDVPIQTVVTAIDAAKKAGIARFVIGTKPQE